MFPCILSDDRFLAINPDFFIKIERQANEVSFLQHGLQGNILRCTISLISILCDGSENLVPTKLLQRHMKLIAEELPNNTVICFFFNSPEEFLKK